MALIESDSFDEDQCLALLARSQLGRIAMSLWAVPVVIPVRYALRGSDLYFALTDPKAADGARDSVVALQADGYHEDSEHRWSVLAIGRASAIQIIAGSGGAVDPQDPQDPPVSVKVSLTDPEVPPELLVPPLPLPRHVFRVQVEIFSGGWQHL